jgi:hypothetical protein
MAWAKKLSGEREHAAPADLLLEIHNKSTLFVGDKPILSVIILSYFDPQWAEQAPRILAMAWIIY